MMDLTQLAEMQKECSEIFNCLKEGQKLTDEQIAEKFPVLSQLYAIPMEILQNPMMQDIMKKMNG